MVSSMVDDALMVPEPLFELPAGSSISGVFQCWQVLPDHIEWSLIDSVIGRGCDCLVILRRYMTGI